MGKTITVQKKQLTDLVAIKNGIMQKEAHRYVQSFLDTLQETIAAGNRVEIRNFGVFTPRVYKIKAPRNPKLGTVLPPVVRKGVHFKASGKFYGGKK